ncbi:MAG: hypothetical protein JOZ07_00890 [Solirubrobacterales bacterium]|nr:hypothetical protein [Solirubrobacterales bacterium]
MPRALLALFAVVAGVGLSACLSACGTTAKPQAGSARALAAARTGVDDPRKRHIVCLRAEHIPVRRVQIGGLPAMQIGVRPSGPTVVFQPTPGAAQQQQIEGVAQGAEVIGSALVYPNQAPDGLMSRVESCVAQGVTG